ncbi:MAG: hypothetical protein ABJA90_02675 [Ginsengibacter sp.]
MENKVNQHNILEFAEQRLEEHMAELNTHYEGREMGSNDEKKKAFETHLNMFTAELTEKCKELGDEKGSQQVVADYQRKFNEAFNNL